MAENSRKPPNTDLWHLHSRLDRLEEKMEQMGNLPYRVEALERDERKRRLNGDQRDRAQMSSSQSSFFGESLFVRTIILGLLAAVIGLATGKFAPGLFQ